MPKLRVSPQPPPLVALVTATTTHHDLWHVHLGDNHLHDLRGNRRTCNDSWKKEEKMTFLETIYLFPGASEGSALPDLNAGKIFGIHWFLSKYFSIFMDTGPSYSRRKRCSKASLPERIKGWQSSLIRKINSIAQT